MVKQNLKTINDIFFISNRIKKINKNYKLYYNLKTQMYEVHDISKPQHSLCITTKDYPSFQILKTLIKSKKENMHSLFLEIEKHNKNIDQEKQQKTLDLSTQKFKEILNFSQNKTSSLSREEIQKIIRN